MWPRVKTVALVTLISVLIWVWAEAESLKTGTATTQVAFVPAPDTAVRVDDPPGGGASVQARVRMEGSTAAIDGAQRVLLRQVALTVGVDGVPGPPGGTFSLEQALRQQRALRAAGVTIVSVEPATVRLTVAKIVPRDLPVVADLTGIDVEGEPTVSPAEVRVMLPEELARTLPEGATATAVIDPEELGHLREEGPQAVQARVRLPAALAQGPGSEFVTLSRETVRVTLRLRQRVETLDLPTVPVWIMLPPTEGRSWDVDVMDPFLRGVKVTGPTDLVQRLRRRELVVVAFVALSSDELAAGIAAKTAVFAPVPAEVLGLPGAAGAGGAGEVALLEQGAPLRFTAESRRVELKIRRRNGGDAGAAPPPS